AASPYRTLQDVGRFTSANPPQRASGSPTRWTGRSAPWCGYLSPEGCVRSPERARGYLPCVRAGASVLEATAGAAGHAAQDRDLVELAGFALAPDAHDSFAADRRRRPGRGGRGPAGRAFRPTGRPSVLVLPWRDRSAPVPTWAAHPARPPPQTRGSSTHW